MNASDLAQKVNAVQRTVQRDLAEMQEQKLISRHGGRKEGRWVVSKLL